MGSLVMEVEDVSVGSEQADSARAQQVAARAKRVMVSIQSAWDYSASRGRMVTRQLRSGER
ncbi:hypothetical protein MACH15_25900 [Maricaulis maris]|nr:hypothetical protein MACH15_25900 [Maricaulis maris]